MTTILQFYKERGRALITSKQFVADYIKAKTGTHFACEVTTTDENDTTVVTVTYTKNVNATAVETFTDNMRLLMNNILTSKTQTSLETYISKLNEITETTKSSAPEVPGSPHQKKITYAKQFTLPKTVSINNVDLGEEDADKLTGYLSSHACNIVPSAPPLNNSYQQYQSNYYSQPVQTLLPVTSTQSPYAQLVQYLNKAIIEAKLPFSTTDTDIAELIFLATFNQYQFLGQHEADALVKAYFDTATDPAKVKFTYIYKNGENGTANLKKNIASFAQVCGATPLYVPMTNPKNGEIETTVTFEIEINRLYEKSPSFAFEMFKDESKSFAAREFLMGQHKPTMVTAKELRELNAEVQKLQFPTYSTTTGTQQLWNNETLWKETQQLYGIDLFNFSKMAFSSVVNNIEKTPTSTLEKIMPAQICGMRTWANFFKTAFAVEQPQSASLVTFRSTNTTQQTSSSSPVETHNPQILSTLNSAADTMLAAADAADEYLKARQTVATRPPTEIQKNLQRHGMWHSTSMFVAPTRATTETVDNYRHTLN